MQSRVNKIMQIGRATAKLLVNSLAIHSFSSLRMSATTSTYLLTDAQMDRLISFTQSWNTPISEIPSSDEAS